MRITINSIEQLKTLELEYDMKDRINLSCSKLIANFKDYNDFLKPLQEYFLNFNYLTTVPHTHVITENQIKFDKFNQLIKGQKYIQKDFVAAQLKEIKESIVREIKANDIDNLSSSLANIELELKSLNFLSHKPTLRTIYNSRLSGLLNGKNKDLYLIWLAKKIMQNKLRRLPYNKGKSFLNSIISKKTFSKDFYSYFSPNLFTTNNLADQLSKHTGIIFNQIDDYIALKNLELHSERLTSLLSKVNDCVLEKLGLGINTRKLIQLMNKNLSINDSAIEHLSSIQKFDTKIIYSIILFGIRTKHSESKVLFSH
jgi:hypothetical protein